MDDKYKKECKLFNVDCFRVGVPYFVKDRHYTYYGILTEAMPTCLTFYCSRAYQTSELKCFKKAELMELELLESKQDNYAVSFTKEQK